MNILPLSRELSLQTKYSPRTIEGLGLVDGEGTERLWSSLGRIALIVKEMSPNNWDDTVQEHLLHYGWKIFVNMSE